MAQDPFLRTLKILRALVDSPVSTGDLCQRFEISARQLARDLDEIRDLGADLESVRFPEGWLWVCTNARAIESRGLLQRWIDLEETRAV